MAVARAHGNLSGVSGVAGAVRYRIGRGSSGVLLPRRPRARQPSAAEASHRSLFAESVRAWKSAGPGVQGAWIEAAAALADPPQGAEPVSVSGFGWFMRSRLIFGAAGLSPPSVPVLGERPLSSVGVRAFPAPSSGALSLELVDRPVLPDGAAGFVIFYVGNFGRPVRTPERKAWRVLQIWPLALGVPGITTGPVQSFVPETVGGGVGFWIAVRLVSPGLFSSNRQFGPVEIAPAGSAPLFRVWKFGAVSVAVELKPTANLYRVVFDKGGPFEAEAVMPGVGTGTTVGDVLAFFRSAFGLDAAAEPGADLSLTHSVQAFRPLIGLTDGQQPRLSFTE